MVDLVNDVLRKTKAFEPQVWQTFAYVLKDANISMYLVGNPDRWSHMQSTLMDDLPRKKQKGRRRRSSQLRRGNDYTRNRIKYGAIPTCHRSDCIPIYHAAENLREAIWSEGRPV